MVAKQQTTEFYRDLGTRDALQGKPPNPLPGIDPCWTELYAQSYQQTLQTLQPNESEDLDIPF